MKKQSVTVQEIREIGDKVLNAIRLSDEDVEKVVAGPQLFGPIMSAIRAGQPRHEPEAHLGGWPLLHGLQLQTSVVTFGVLIIFAVGVIGLMNFAASKEVATDTQPIIVPTDSPTVLPAALDPSQFQGLETASYENVPKRSHSNIKTVKTRRAKKQITARAEEYGEFYQISYAGDLEESKANGQLVRVQLPRESLIAMGVSIPTAIDTENIKTDLLIGEDGVARAVRLVN